MKNLITLLCALTFFSACSPKHKTEQTEPVQEKKYTEKYRPAFHFSPDHNWTNDPNGLVYLDGEYHVFYQYNPLGNTWGHMSWGHAVSKDLLQWKHLPVALSEYIDKQSGDSTMIFSGSAVVDVNNTSGFFPKDSSGIVAIYTSHLHRNNKQLTQHQSIAYSNDRGRTFTNYQNNPVLDIKKKDFRDPKVFWYEHEKKWIMSVVIPDQFIAQFYESKNLKEWKFLSDFGPIGDTAKIWECPDLIEVSVAGQPEKKKWVLLISNSHPQGPRYVGMQYFVGNFDGKKFTADNPKQYPLYLDYGKDFYAAVTFNNIPKEDGRTILLGWANNWAYAQAIPTSPWRSAMTLPRELYLKNTAQGYRLIQKPIRELLSLRADSIDHHHLGSIFKEQAFEIEYEFIGGSTNNFGLTLATGKDEETIIGYDKAKEEVYLDRTKSGNVKFHPDFSSIERAPVKLKDGRLKLNIFIDHSIVEVFINDGEQVITDQIFPTSNEYEIKTFSKEGDAITNVNVWKMKSVWD